MTAQVPCKFFMSGCCAYGNGCRFSHEVLGGGGGSGGGGAPSGSGGGGGGGADSQVCKFFLSGNCAYGDKCRFLHSRANGQQRSAGGRPAGPLPPAGGGPPGVYKWPSGADEFGLLESSDPNPNWDDYMDPDEMDAFAAEWQQQQAEAAYGYGDFDEGDVMDPADIPLCEEYEATGACRGGDDCPLIHGDQCKACGLFSIHPYSPELIEAHKAACKGAAAGNEKGEGAAGGEDAAAEREGGAEGGAGAAADAEALADGLAATKLEDS